MDGLAGRMKVPIYIWNFRFNESSIKSFGVYVEINSGFWNPFLRWNGLEIFLRDSDHLTRTERKRKNHRI